ARAFGIGALERLVKATVPLVMVVTEIAFLCHCSVTPKCRKHNTQPHDEAHLGSSSNDPASKQNERLTLGSVPQRGPLPFDILPSTLALGIGCTSINETARVISLVAGD